MIDLNPFFKSSFFIFRFSTSNLVFEWSKRVNHYLKLTIGILFFLTVSSCKNQSETVGEQGDGSPYFMAGYGGDYTDAGTFAIQTSDSGFVVVGLTSTYPVGDQGLLVV